MMQNDQLGWPEIKALYDRLAGQPLEAGDVERFLADWSTASNHIEEWSNAAWLATMADTSDEAASEAYDTFVSAIQPAAQAAEQRLRERFLAIDACPAGFETARQRMAAEAAIFHAGNLPLLAEEAKIEERYNAIVGAQTVERDGAQVPLARVRDKLQDQDRAVREAAWRQIAGRKQADRAAIDGLWEQAFALRQRLAETSGCADYRAYRWQQLQRIDYAPGDCEDLHAAIAQAVVPALRRVNQRRAAALGLDRLRPWDRDAPDPTLPEAGEPRDVAAFCGDLFARLDPQLDARFQTLKREGRLDLEPRLNKAPGAYCIELPITRRPVVFMNSAGGAAAISTLCHEMGHALHFFERQHLPYAAMAQVGNEAAEMAAISLELLALPELIAADSAWGRGLAVERLEHCLRIWATIGAMDTFQHWAYANPAEGGDPRRCDQQWRQLAEIFGGGVAWDGDEDELARGWQDQRHLLLWPFYGVEYGIAQIAAVQLLENALDQPRETMARYRQALALGGAAPLAAIYETAGAAFRFDAPTLERAVATIERLLARLAA